jgi:hypothetical protein
MLKVKKYRLREIGRSVLEKRGYQTEIQTGQGLLPGARLIASKDGQTIEVAVRTSHQRAVSFTTQPDGRWRGLAVDLIVAVVPAEKNYDGVDVLAFDARSVEERFDLARQGLQETSRASNFEMPVFIPLDKTSRKNVGHSVSNLKEMAHWIDRVPASDVNLRVRADHQETFIDRVKREFAEKNEVDVSKVFVEFRILT